MTSRTPIPVARCGRLPFSVADQAVIVVIDAVLGLQVDDAVGNRGCSAIAQCVGLGQLRIRDLPGRELRVEAKVEQAKTEPAKTEPTKAITPNAVSGEDVRVYLLQVSATLLAYSNKNAKVVGLAARHAIAEFCEAVKAIQPRD